MSFAAMSFSQTEHYVAAGVCFMGGVLGLVGHLWLLFDFLPQIRMAKGLRCVHNQLAIANLFVLAFFFVSAVSHFEQGWIFGDKMCKFYVFWCKFTPNAAVALLAVVLHAEYQHASKPAKRTEDFNYTWVTVLAWLNGLVWGTLALTWSKYGQEPAAFTCTVIWYEQQAYVTAMIIFAFGLPVVISAFYALRLASGGYLKDNPLAKSAVGLLFTMVIQLAGYGGGYIWILMGYKLNLYMIGFATIWTKVFGIAHPFVYSTMFAAKDAKVSIQREGAVKKKE